MVTSAVGDLFREWEVAQLGVGAKIHMIRSHLMFMLGQLADGVYSEQALESSHSVYKVLNQRYKGVANGLKFSVMEYNFTRL